MAKPEGEARAGKRLLSFWTFQFSALKGLNRNESLKNTNKSNFYELQANNYNLLKQIIITNNYFFIKQMI